MAYMKKTKGSKRKVRKTRRIKGGASQTQPISAQELHNMITNVQTKLGSENVRRNLDLDSVYKFNGMLRELLTNIHTDMDTTQEGQKFLEGTKNIVMFIDKKIDEIVKQ